MNEITPWGWSTTIDLYDCNIDKITNSSVIKNYVNELVTLLDMTKYGECHIVNFGQDQKVTGFSMFQLIETSNISAHFANYSKSAYIDIFSCKEYDSKKAALLSKDFFEAKKYILHEHNRY